MTDRFPSLTELVAKIDSPNREKCFRLWTENADRFKFAWGSSHNHQAWPGGYLDHLTDIMNIAVGLYELLSRMGPLPFSLSDALYVLFLHDAEKPWRFDPVSGAENVGLRSKDAKEAFRLEKLAEYGFTFTEAQENALKYVEGEKDDYRSDRRVMNELAGFCHACDVISARVRHDRRSA